MNFNIEAIVSLCGSREVEGVRGSTELNRSLWPIDISAVRTLLAADLGFCKTTSTAVQTSRGTRRGSPRCEVNMAAIPGLFSRAKNVFEIHGNYPFLSVIFNREPLTNLLQMSYCSKVQRLLVIF